MGYVMAVDRHRWGPERLIGEVIDGRYRVEALIGKGGFGAVYRVHHVPTGSKLALKTLRPDLDPTQQLLARLEREARATSVLSHPNIVEVLDMGRLGDGTLFVAMELADGVSIAELIERRAIHPRRALVLARQALDGISHAHKHGVVHRDLKPDNMMVVSQGEAGAEYDQLKLLDFGLVKLIGDAANELDDQQLTAMGDVFGTPEYMAPEQALGRQIDGRTDLYAMGVVLFEMLTGRPPFAHENPAEILRMHVTAEPPRLADVAPGLPWWTVEIEALVAGALSKRSDHRFSSAEAMMAALDAAFSSVDHIPNTV
jgi:eukaryotic-like serine/threonine-protein kinase